MTRFIDKTDTPCPFRLGRMGFARTGEFRAPKPGELFLLPSASDPLEEHEPQVVGACGEFTTGERRHIVVALSEDTRREMEEMGPFFLFFGSDEAHNELMNAHVEQEETDPCD